MTIERRALGKTGLSVSVLGFGGSEIGFQGTNPDQVGALLNGALDSGLNLIDTAECYVDSEEKIGQSVAHRRDQFLLLTKVGHEHGLGKGADWSADSIARSIDRSLTRLRTDRLDLVQLHSCSAEIIARGECIDALELAKAAGKTRFIGYSGDGVDALAAVRTGRFDTLQTSINVADQQVLDGALPEAAARGMGVIAKRPIANAAWQHAQQPANNYHVEYWRRLSELKFPFQRLAMDEAVSVALRFTLSQPGVHTAIVGTTKPGRWAQNAALLGAGPLSADELGSIRARWREVAPASWVGMI
jgi:aryl-alcohol dehydrogenase-like predicted oxidoreductase